MKYAISIPIGAWNNFLPYTLESLRQQNADMSIALLDASGDPRVKSVADQYDGILDYRRHGPDEGQSDAIMEGWDNTDGEFLGWLNADDSLFPNTLEMVSEYLRENPDLDLVYGHSTIVDEHDRTIGYHFNVEPPGDRLFEGCTISQPSCFFRRTTYNQVGGLNRSLHYTMDWDLWLRLYSEEAHFAFIDQPMSRVLWASDTKSASFNARRREELKALIAKYSPEEKKRFVFKSFAIHAAADMIWPAALRTRAIRWLRRGGQRVFGIRADGEIADGAELILVHYNTDPAHSLVLDVHGDLNRLNLSCGRLANTHVNDEQRLRLEFSRPVEAGELVRLKLNVDNYSESRPVFFNHATWRY